MRKRRRLADKLTISVCAVLVAVSAFFYAPMDVSAEEVSYLELNALSNDEALHYSSGNVEIGRYQYYGGYLNQSTDSFDLVENLQSDLYYEVDLSLAVDVSINDLGLSNDFLSLYSTVFSYGNLKLVHSGSRVIYDTSQYVFDSTLVAKGSDLIDKAFNIQSYVLSYYSNLRIVNVDWDYTVNSVTTLSDTDGDDYKNGYNAGYSAGEQAGYGNGYSNGFADGEASVDTDKIYDEAFQAGKDSVDTQSYYDAGYQAGYQVAYQEGFDSGYDEGYENAMNKVGQWGADTSDYPILVFEKNLSDVSCLMEVVTSMPSVGHGQVNLCNLDININPSHTYKIVFDSVYPSTSVGDFSGSQNEQFNYNIGLFSIPWSGGESFGFVQGSSLSSVFRLEVYDYSAHYYEIGGENDVFQPWGAYRIYNFDSIDVFVYDMGPSGDTQNHIANQTDKLNENADKNTDTMVNGFDNSQGNAVNSDLSSGLDEYQTAEDSLWATATTGLKDFTFFDFASVPAMITGMSFITAIMGSWFNQAGGASGVGIVLSILFSVVLVAMVLGLYRWYQSRGGKK